MTRTAFAVGMIALMGALGLAGGIALKRWSGPEAPPPGIAAMTESSVVGSPLPSFAYPDLEGMTRGPDAWADNHRDKGSADVFDSLQVREDGIYEQQMGFCPLVELWREEGCTADEVRLLCDIAMEGDRGRAEHHGLTMELPATIAGGAERGRLIVRDGGA